MIYATCVLLLSVSPGPSSSFWSLKYRWAVLFGVSEEPLISCFVFEYPVFFVSPKQITVGTEQQCSPEMLSHIWHVERLSFSSWQYLIFSWRSYSLPLRQYLHSHSDFFSWMKIWVMSMNQNMGLWAQSDWAEVNFMNEPKQWWH